MSLVDELERDISEIFDFKDKWNIREGVKVPEPEDIRLGNDAIELEAAVLYADLEDSTSLVKGHKWWFSAEVYKSYLATTCKIIRANNGYITSFDGDRVMAIFIGELKESNAAKCALNINWTVKNLINEEIKKIWPSTSYLVKQAVGVDSGKIYCARTGIRKFNDIVWIGKAANYAAKLCSVRVDEHSSWISESVFNKLNQNCKYSSLENKLMWASYSWKATGGTIYGSDWTWKPK
jgi:class 3 adenylate cyclase